jgi:Amt family ammonium transporter
MSRTLAPDETGHRHRRVSGSRQRPPDPKEAAVVNPGAINSGDTAWVLVSTALVLLMTPGLALFYGGMVRAKSVVNMMLMSFGALGVVIVLWVLYGYSMAFGDDVGGGLLGNPLQELGLTGLVGSTTDVGGVPVLAFVAFQCVFAVITVALISGAVADRARFGTWLLFTGVWVTVVYFPVAHWVFDFSSDDGTHVGGWLANRLGALDFAGGTAVHVNAGAAGLALALVLGRRVGFGRDPMRAHNLTLVMTGAGLLWFGWFGFNAGSALAANATAALAVVTTLVATAAGMLGWLAVDRLRGRRATALGAVSGVVAGLVAITPACNAVSPLGAIAVGAVAGGLCAVTVDLKHQLGYDDSLDVAGVHLVAGVWGTLSIGLLATSSAPAGVDGLLLGGGVDQLWRQAVGVLAVLTFSFVATFVIGTALARLVGFRVSHEDEVAGVDLAVHGESGYVLDADELGAGWDAAVEDELDPVA